MHLLRTNFDSDNNLGLYGFATDKYCLIGSERYSQKVKDVLKVRTHSLSVLNMDLIKIFCAGNSSGVIVPKILADFDDESLDKIKKHFDVMQIKDWHTSMGNLFLMNDNGIIISPLLKKHKNEVEKFFGLQCEVTTIARMSIVGSVGFCTNKGCLLHPKVKEKEKKTIEKTLQVDADICTVNFGSPYPGSGIIANSNGFIVSEATSGPELGRITDVLGFL